MFKPLVIQYFMKCEDQTPFQTPIIFDSKSYTIIRKLVFIHNTGRVVIH